MRDSPPSKKLAMRRASQLNSDAGLKATLNDLWESTGVVRANVNKLDKKYGLSRNIRDFSRGLYLITNQSLGKWLDEVRKVGRSVGGGSANAPAKKRSVYLTNAINPWFPTWLLGPQSQYNPPYRRIRHRNAISREKAMRRDRDRLRELQQLKRETRARAGAAAHALFGADSVLLRCHSAWKRGLPTGHKRVLRTGTGAIRK